MELLRLAACRIRALNGPRRAFTIWGYRGYLSAIRGAARDLNGTWTDILNNGSGRRATNSGNARNKRAQQSTDYVIFPPFDHCENGKGRRCKYRRGAED